MNRIEVTLKRIREDKRLSQHEVADMMGISQPTYAKLEANKTKLKLDTLTSFAEALEMKLVDVLMYPEKWVLQSASQQYPLKPPLSNIEANEKYGECQACKMKDQQIESYKEQILLLKDNLNDLRKGNSAADAMRDVS